MTQFKRVLVATDLSADADTALREGARLALANGGKLGVVHVLPRTEPIHILFPQLNAASALQAAAFIERAEEVLQERVETVTGMNDFETFIEEGDVSTGIIISAIAWRADVLVIGAAPRGLFSKLFSGVTEHVMRDAPCPVLVARSYQGGGGVLAATDLTNPTLPAVMAASQAAQRSHSQLKVVHAVGFLDIETSYFMGGAGDGFLRNSDFGALAKKLRSAVDGAGVEARCEIIDGIPARANVREADSMHADLVVLSTHHKSGVSRLLSGSVAETVARAAGCSVLVVPAPLP